ncbi:uncharacterized protein LOC119666140 [Teleopsis dalmanni]|nr:uncharacterized protein LOC119666140 [Teleopsis dalmanni]
MVLSKLTSAQPNNSFNEDLKKWDNYCLADPMFNKSDRIDIVLGADILTEILQPGLRKWGKILGQETSLGWILSGVINTNNTVKTIISAVTSNIERFWEIEEVCEASEINETDKECENWFKSTTTLNKENRFIVKLPFKKENELGDSRKMAMARLLCLEKRFKRNSKLKKEYIKFMKEYMEMGHMQKVS